MTTYVERMVTKIKIFNNEIISEQNVDEID